MQVLASVPNIKIPYAVEGVIRTAQLDDTIAPEDSVQLAVNMNFDRVGAIQTRLGVTTYAESLAESISNYGTLRNSVIPAGYTKIYQIGSDNDLATTFSDPAAVKISDTKVAVFWNGVDGDGFARNFETDIETGAMTGIGTALEFDTTAASGIKAIQVTDSIVLVAWTGSGSDGFVQCFNVSADSITALSSPLEFDATNGEALTLAQVDANHFICFYQGTGGDGFATIFEVNLGTGAVTEPGATLTFDTTTDNQANSCAAIGNGTHFVNFWRTTQGLAQAFSVNTGTWTITAIGTPLVFSTIGTPNNAVAVGDGEHFVNMYEGAVGYFAQAFNVDPGTYAVTAVGTGVDINLTGGNNLFGIGFGDGEHFVAFYTESIGEGYVQMIEMDPTTFDMSLVGQTLPDYDFANNGYTTGVTMSNYKVFAIWGNDDQIDGKSAMFQTFGDVVNGRWLYASHTDEVSNYPVGGPWTSRRSGLAQVSKPRFSQYLGYIWMVNGNEAIGGDPVATSNGGAFGTDLVPEFFPKGDFISAGFEGRVWVADRTLGVIYYTDIVQFIPPFTYSLTYNADVNFISTIAPQTGEQFTALYEVPRALLVFTENTITRIYGATSLDAYPAYQVGTYSQESIVETKTGIFFHHSSGFYQFDYGSQPVEISRRIIDFVKAIPRASYDDIVGVYDGFDCIEWSVGQVVVEGVVFSKCVLRYTISTQVWTVYDYVGISITAMIQYDDGTTQNYLMGTSTGLTGAMGTGFTDFGASFYYEYIDRWRSFTDMYYQTKAASGFSVYSENAAGANLSYQKQKSGANAWIPIGTVTEANNSLLPNSGTDEFDVMRLRLAGNTSGAQVVVHGIEITELEIRGQETN